MKTGRFKGWLAFLAVSSVFISLLCLSWMQWGDLIVDTGREMYAPLRIISGDCLYRDFYYIYGPFSAYFSAIFFKLLGARLDSLIVSGIIAAICAAFLVYKLSRIFLGSALSAFSASAFLIVLAFGQYVYYANYNFILPYSFGAAHAMVFALAALYFYYLSLKDKSYSRSVWAGVFIALALLSKIEVGAAALIAVTFCLALEGGVWFRRMLVLTVMPLAASGWVYLLFSLHRAGLGDPLRDLFSSARLSASMPAWLSGTANIKENSIVIIKSFFNYAALTVFFICGGLAVNRIKKQGARLVIAAIFIAAACLCAKKFFPFDWQFRPLPFFLLGTAAALLAIVFRAKTDSRKDKALALLGLSITAFLLLARVFFFVRAGHYGFYLLAPGLIVYYVLFLELIPRALPAAINKNFFKAAYLTVFIFFIAGHFSVTRFCWRNKTLRVESPVGTIYTFDNAREERCRQLIDYLRLNTPADATLVVFPEGVMINFMSSRVNPLRYCMYMPLDLAKKNATETVLAELEAKSIDYLAVNQRLGDEQGYPVFGRDYAQPIAQYIEEKYELIKQFGPMPFTSEDYGIALYRRK